MEFVSAQARSTPYWKTTLSAAQREQTLRRRAARDEVQDRLEVFFGAAAADMHLRVFGRPIYNGRSYLPPERMRQLRALERDYLRSGMELGASAESLPLGFDDAQRQARALEWQQSKRAAIEAWLSPAEFQEYLVRDSPAANYVRGRLPEARSEDEFRRMVQLADAYSMGQPAVSLGQRYGLAPTANPEVDIRLQEREQAFLRELRELLGEDRMPAWQEAQRP
jgi:hypothetical protein